MKKYLPFFAIFLMISTIPALVFALFPNAASNINSGDIPSFNQNADKKSAGPQEIQTPDYLVRWRSEPTLLRVKQPMTLIVNILSRASGSPWEGQPTAVLHSDSKLSGQSQAIPVNVKATEPSGTFHLKATVPQAGPWVLHLTLNPNQAPVVIRIYVPES